MNCKEVYIKILPKQVCYKVENGESSETPLRLGRLSDELYRNRNVITTIYGEEAFTPRVEVKTLVHTDDKCYIIITISNNETKTTVKQITLRSQPNNLTISDMKETYDEIIDLLNKETDTGFIDLIDLLRNKKSDNIEIEEYC